MKRIYISLILSFFCGFSGICQKQKNTQRPNILFILADDLGYTDLSCMGSKYYETPNIDQIASKGLVFTNGYAASQVCSPSRASIMTGKFTARHDITNIIGVPSGEAWRTRNRFSKMLPPEFTSNLPAKYITLPEAMKAEGYTTFFAGKWHLGGKGFLPEDNGFDINIGGWDAGSPKGGYFSPFANPKLPDGPKGEDLQMRMANETVKFMKENKDKPFFAYLSFYAVHEPIQSTEALWEKYCDKAEKMGISEQGFAIGQRLPYRLHQDNPVYAGLIESMDDAVGIILKKLKELGLDKNTIVIFTSDNGGVTSGDNYSTNNAPLRGGKGNQWEGGVREPYFIQVPWMNLAGKKSDVPVSGTDFYPTILDLAGLPLRPEQHNDGVSLLPLLKGGKIADRSLIWHYPHYGNQGGDPTSMIRRGNWKLIYYHEDGHQELYNLKTDLSETTDVSAKNLEKVKQLHTELFDYLKKVGAKFPQKDPEYSEEAEKKYQLSVEHKIWPQLEKQRKDMLSPIFDPKNNWWGSKPTND
ncbi:Arylsulfatase [Arcticibacter svalbardensis MN12-7]|uniref:Arylsulfatase n=1 Tax=Arcticibacter svalbardensis MN12-7 TaxID=1150600 RepID=R9GLQ3_9SPHI|nr:sulfatase [Arcticibacter svalbardensis]EOR92757.1 Arylsulfatase [Arcticibacter svalbardensis MN12-7]